jgi:hypothetical protein
MHAVIMVRFAFDCSAVMNQVLRDLVPILGANTMELSMRFGLHSGPVTGESSFLFFPCTCTCIVRDTLSYPVSRFSFTLKTTAGVLRGDKVCYILNLLFLCAFYNLSPHTFLTCGSWYSPAFSCLGIRKYLMQSFKRLLVHCRNHSHVPLTTH